MLTFARKPNTTLPVNCVKSAILPRTRPAQSADVNLILHLQRTIGNQNVQRLFHDISQMPLFSTQHRNSKRRLKGIDPGIFLNRIHKEALGGFRGSAKPLPHLEMIQKSFGRHALSGIKTFIGGPAGNTNKRMGSTAYTTDESIAFKQWPDLRVAAHEAAHIVQQRAGVPIRDVLDNSAGRYEKEAEAVADSVVHGVSTEHLLDKYSKPRAARTNLVQCDNGVCTDLRSALSNSIQVIELLEDYLAGNIEWGEVREHIRTVGMAGEGVVGAGRDLPPIVQDAINEAEGWRFEDITHFGRMVIGLPSLAFGSGEFFNEQWSRNEIERQNRLNLVYIQYMYENNCPDFPGQWTDFQQQILPIGTRGSEQRSTIESPREARTALAWVAIGDEHILVLATEVAGSGRLRFVRWIDSEMRDLALRQARDRQGSIPVVESSAVTRLPSNVPGSAARR